MARVGWAVVMDGKRLSELLGLLYEGLACPERWPDFLSAVSRELGCDKAAFVFHDQKNQSPVMGFQVGFAEEAMRDYNAYYGARNPAALPIVQAALRHGSWLGLVRAVVDERSYKKSEYYGGWGRQHGVFHAVCGAASGDGVTATSLTLMRAESRGPLGEDTVEIMGLLVPHLKRAFQIHKQMEVLRASVEGAKTALDHLDAAVAAVDGDGRVVLINAQAEAMLQSGHVLSLRERRLAVTDPRQSGELDRLVRVAALTGAGRGASPGGAMMIQESVLSRPIAISVIPFCSSHLLADPRPCALVFLRDATARPASRASVLSALFQLTPAECRLADLLFTDMDLRTAAEGMHITLETARFMLKNIFRKTATHRQSELICLLANLPGQTRRTKISTLFPPSIPSHQRG